MNKLPRARIRHAKGRWRAVAVHASEGYLFVHRDVWYRFRPCGFSVSHKPSGAKVPGTHTFDLQSAIAIMRALSPIIPRYVGSLPKRKADALKARVESILERFA